MACSSDLEAVVPLCSTLAAKFLCSVEHAKNPKIDNDTRREQEQHDLAIHSRLVTLSANRSNTISRNTAANDIGMVRQ